jgi:hypothetical protein
LEIKFSTRRGKKGENVRGFIFKERAFYEKEKWNDVCDKNLGLELYTS